MEEGWPHEGYQIDATTYVRVVVGANFGPGLVGSRRGPHYIRGVDMSLRNSIAKTVSSTGPKVEPGTIITEISTYALILMILRWRPW